MTTFQWAEPLWLLLLLLIIPMIWRDLRRRARVPLSHQQRFVRRRTEAAAGAQDRLRGAHYLRHTGLLLRTLALVLLALAMARPQFGRSSQKRKSSGLDIMLVVDASKSMLAMDFEDQGRRVGRLDVVKRVISDFVGERANDRLGLTVFGTHAFPYVPLTLDHDVLRNYVDELHVGMAGDATSIGDALGVATNRLKNLDAPSKVVILLTDGASQKGRLDPKSATEAAAALGIKVYTIGVGTNGLVSFPTELGYRRVRFELDEELLEHIAERTGGRYFKASDTQALEKVYATIDELERREVEVETYHNYDERFAGLLWPALVALFFELSFSLTRFRRLL